MIYAVCGGKGGTGKSTFAVYLHAKTNALLVDTDVENPNLYTLMGTEKGKEIARAYIFKPVLIKEKCRKCGICVENCRFNAIFMPKDGYPIFLHDMCEGCGVCWNVCPFGAIEKKKEEIGRVYYNREARLLTGETEGEALPVIRKSIEVAKKIAKDIILDCPAGIHCNAIFQMMEADRVFVVAEPTPLGFNGALEALKTLQEIGKRGEVVINRSRGGKWEKEIERIAEELGNGIFMKIPYSKEIARAYFEGKLLEYWRGRL